MGGCPMRACRAFLLLAALALPGLGSSAEPRSVAVAVAANLRPAFEEIAARFQARKPGVEVKATFGASGNFFAQLSSGAPFDLFLSGDADFPAKVVEQGLAALADPSVQKLAIANPGLAPYGRAAKSALEKAGLYEKLRGRLVMGQSVSQTAQFAQSGNAQAGFLPLSLAKTPPLSHDGRSWPVPASSYQRIEQAGVIVKGAKQAALARELAAFLTGDGARDVLERYGYDVPVK